MKRRVQMSSISCAVAVLHVVILSACSSPSSEDHAVTPSDGFDREFGVTNGDLVSTGTNPYFVLEPGYRCTFEGTEEKKKTRLIITVTDETRRVDGVETRVVEERESVDDDLVEVSRNFFAISKRTNDVFYFGEEVDIYDHGKIKNHEGAWLSGENGAKYGLFMPGSVQIGRKYYQEMAPGVALDRFEIKSNNTTLDTPAGRFDHCLKVEETTPLEPGNREYKIYANGIGLVKDGDLLLVSHGRDR